MAGIAGLSVMLCHGTCQHNVARVQPVIVWRYSSSGSSSSTNTTIDNNTSADQQQ